MIVGRRWQIFILAPLLFVLCNCGQTPSKPAANQSKESPRPVAIEISVQNAKFAVFGRELSEPKDYLNLKAGEKLTQKFELDVGQKAQLKFDVRDKKGGGGGGESIALQQAFVALVHQPSQREIIYVAEADTTTKTYTFDLDMKAHVKDFAGVSGKYSIKLILGDAAVSNPLNWHFAQVDVTVPELVDSAPKTPVKSQQISYNKLPEIKHKFREQEARAPAIISDSFALLCALPLILLFALWLRIGLNFDNARYSLWALGFHGGLIAIFCLYTLYWLKLNMFETLKYLAVIGAPTFICGNLLLRSFASSAHGDADKSSKSE